MKPDIVIHDPADSVGVTVVEGIEAGQELAVWIMDTNENTAIVSKDAIPLGHKIALVDPVERDALITCGHDIGMAVEDIPPGHHVHVHNVKTKKW